MALETLQNIRLSPVSNDGGTDYGNYYVQDYGNYHEENYGNYEEFNYYEEEMEESADVDERIGVKVIGPRSLSLCLPLSRLECGLLGDTELSNKILTFIEVNLLSVNDILLDLFVKAGNIRTKDINEFMNSQLRSLLLSLPPTATQILIFPNDFASNKVGIPLRSSRIPRSFSSGCREEAELSRGQVSWRLRGNEVLEPTFSSLSRKTVFLQVNDESDEVRLNVYPPGPVPADRHGHRGRPGGAGVL